MTRDWGGFNDENVIRKQNENHLDDRVAIAGAARA